MKTDAEPESIETYLVVNIITQEIVTANRDEDLAHVVASRISEFNGRTCGFAVKTVTLH